MTTEPIAKWRAGDGAAGVGWTDAVLDAGFSAMSPDLQSVVSWGDNLDRNGSDAPDLGG
jgi:hypothetical protein